MRRLQCQIPYTNHRDIILPSSPFSVARNERAHKKLTCYIYEQDGHLFQWVAGPTSPSSRRSSQAKGGHPGTEPRSGSRRTWSDLDRAESMVIVLSDGGSAMPG